MGKTTGAGIYIGSSGGGISMNPDARIIIVSSCAGCTFHRKIPTTTENTKAFLGHEHDVEYICIHEKVVEKEIPKSNFKTKKIPKWCPLETPTRKQELDRRIFVSKKIQSAGNNLYESLSFCKPLQYLAGELMAQNEEYVLNHCGADETIGTVNILQNGFTDNQIAFLKDLERIIKTADYNELLQTVLQKVNEMIKEVQSQDESTFSLLRDFRQIKTEIESCGTRPAIILKKNNHPTRCKK